jgi:hypothetical protein
MDISILNFLNLNLKTYFIFKMIFEVLNFFSGSKINIYIGKITD